MWTYKIVEQRNKPTATALKQFNGIKEGDDMTI
jgi:hypothetical protein